MEMEGGEQKGIKENNGGSEEVQQSVEKKKND